MTQRDGVGKRVLPSESVANTSGATIILPSRRDRRRVQAEIRHPLRRVGISVVDGRSGGDTHDEGDQDPERPLVVAAAQSGTTMGPSVAERKVRTRQVCLRRHEAPAMARTESTRTDDRALPDIGGFR